MQLFELHAEFFPRGPPKKTRALRPRRQEQVFQGLYEVHHCFHQMALEALDAEKPVFKSFVSFFYHFFPSSPSSVTSQTAHWPSKNAERLNCTCRSMKWLLSQSTSVAHGHLSVKGGGDDGYSWCEVLCGQSPLSQWNVWERERLKIMHLPFFN